MQPYVYRILDWTCLEIIIFQSILIHARRMFHGVARMPCLLTSLRHVSDRPANRHLHIARRSTMLPKLDCASDGISQC